MYKVSVEALKFIKAEVLATGLTYENIYQTTQKFVAELQVLKEFASGTISHAH